MKTYVIILSQTYPTTHKRAGEKTFFKEMLGNGRKLHTIRSNYPLWKKRLEEVQSGLAVLSIRQWSGKPYKSKQFEICRLSVFDRAGIQKLTFCGSLNRFLIDDKEANQYIYDLPNNDGLTVADFEEWFKKYDLSRPMAIIHFTKFRY